ncbi:hypothetical protein DRJ16_06355, partial [Candidatus Woesearchaeota archaeon]
MNVIFITVDCLRADHLSCLGYDKKTPTIDSLAKEGFLFTQAISTGVPTSNSFPGILASTYPVYEVSKHHWRKLPKNATLISEVLRKNGYVTAAFHSNPMLSRYYGYSRGFDIFDDSLLFKIIERRNKLQNLARKITRGHAKAYKLAAKIYWTGVKIKNLFQRYLSQDQPYERAEIITQKAISWLKNSCNKKFFLWLH